MQLGYMVECDERFPTIFESWGEVVESLGELSDPFPLLPFKISTCIIMKGEEDGSDSVGCDPESD